MRQEARHGLSVGIGAFLLVRVIANIRILRNIQMDLRRSGVFVSIRIFAPDSYIREYYYEVFAGGKNRHESAV